jgi:hypothetical protein
MPGYVITWNVRVNPVWIPVRNAGLLFRINCNILRKRIPEDNSEMQVVLSGYTIILFLVRLAFHWQPAMSFMIL